MTPTKDEMIKAREWVTVEADHLPYHEGSKHRDTILHALDAQIKACDVPKIEGLEDAILSAEELMRLMPFPQTWLHILLPAARAYHKMTGGDDAV